MFSVMFASYVAFMMMALETRLATGEPQLRWSCFEGIESVLAAGATCGGFHKWRYPQVDGLENTIKVDDLGVPQFQETP